MGRKNSKKKKEKSKYKFKQSRENLVKGILDISRSGTGFAIVENQPVDILIRRGDFNSALHGDTVLVKIKDGKEKTGRQRGVVTEVLKRKLTDFIGRLEMNKGFAFFVAEMDKPMPDIFIPPSGIN